MHLVSFVRRGVRAVRSIPSRVAAFFAVVALAVSANAETPTFTVDTSAASTAVTELKTKISDFITGDLAVAFLTVLGAGVIIWLVMLAWKKFKKAGNAAG